MEFFRKKKDISVLIVDESKQIIKHLKKELKTHRDKFNFFFAVNNKELDKVLDKEEINLIIVDFNYNNNGGSDLLKEIHDTKPEIVRILSGSNLDSEDILEGSDVAHQFIEKPYSVRKLINKFEQAEQLSKLLENKSLRSLISGLNSVPILPDVYAKLLQEMNSSNFSLKRMGDLISQDLSLTTKVLQLSNSAMFANRETIHNPQQAAVMLGISTLRALILYVQVFFNNEYSQFSGLDIKKVEQHSHKVAELGVNLAQKQNLPKHMIDDIYVAGLLHDFGKLVLLTVSEQYPEVVSYHKKHQIPLYQAEKEILGTTHAEIGAYLLGLWGLPKDVVDAVAYHHEPLLSGNNEFSTLTITHFTNALSLNKNAKKIEDLPELNRWYIKYLNMEDQISEWISENSASENGSN